MRRGTRPALGALLGAWLLCARTAALPRQLSESAAAVPVAAPSAQPGGASSFDVRGTLHSAVYGLGLLVKAGWPNEHPEQELQLIYALVATAVGVLLALLCFALCRLMWWSARAEFCPCCLREEEVCAPSRACRRRDAASLARQKQSHRRRARKHRPAASLPRACVLCALCRSGPP